MRANCMIIAIAEKIKHTDNVLYYIYHEDKKLTDRLHILWKDIDQREYHFTRDKGVDVKCGLLFKGHIEELRPGTITRLAGKQLNIK